MLSFKTARRRHAMLASRVTDANVTVAEQIYSGVTGCGAAQGDLVTLAVADTMPLEYAVLLATDDIAAAYATVALLDVFSSAKPPASPYQARKVADLGWKAFQKLAEKAAKLDCGLGADMGDSWPVLQAVQDLQPNPEKMQRIATLAGRMYNALRGAKARRVQGIPEEIVGVEQGGDFGALLPQEYAMLATDPTKRHLFSQLTQRRALQFERVGKERKSRGPLVFVQDESGSMHGGRDEWAKAAMTALTRIAWEDKRAVIVVHFATATKAQVLKPGDKAGVVRAQCTFLNGGTDIGCALHVGLEEVDTLSTMGHHGADLVLVSDGADAGTGIPRALDAMKHRGVRLFSIAIDEPFEGDLKERASEYIYLTDSDMRSDGGVLKIAGSVL